MSRAFRLGVFIFGTLSILAAGIFLIGDKQFLFASTYRLKAGFKTVAGLNNGAEIRVGGIHKGIVRQIQLPTQPDGEMTVVMDMESSTRDVIKKDSIASIQTEGLLGNKYVEISFGSGNAPKVNNGDTIGSVPPLDMSDVMRKANEILDSAKESTDNLKAISSKINQGEGTLGALVNDRKMYDQLNAATAEAKEGAAAFQDNMEAMKHNWLLRGFFNKRGYDDPSKLTEDAISNLPGSPYLKKFVFDGKKLFDKPDNAKLKGDKMLTEAGRFLEGNRFGLAIVVATNGMKGDTDEAEVLTQARAMVVRDYLVNNFKMDDTRLKTIGLGKSDQKDAVDGGSVEVIIYPAGLSMKPTMSSGDSVR
ncbi:MAG: MCE family protein [Planctomycetes bacterium]|nr:MCE family protein [Planctomycetota bacterium]